MTNPDEASDAPDALNRLLAHSPHLASAESGLPDIGTSPNGGAFHKVAAGMATAFRRYSSSEKLHLEDLPPPPRDKIRLGGGSPGRFPPFPPALENAVMALSDPDLAYYPLAAGPEAMRQEVASYLKSIGITSVGKHPSSVQLSENNVIFSAGSTHGYDLVIQTISRPGDVVLMTGPNYGLFAFNPERHGRRVELVPLKKEDGWLPDPYAVAAKIDQLNSELRKSSNVQGSSPESRGVTQHIPRVAAFLNMNPHNPTGKVMGRRQLSRLHSLSKVCLDRGVFVIDDLVYRDLCYDEHEMAVPVASIPSMFQNTITLLSLSKAYGLAGLRAGVVVADEAIVRSLRNRIFQSHDSLSLLQAAAISGAFNASASRSIAYAGYFSHVVNEYKLRFNIVAAMIRGIDVVTMESDREAIVDLVNQYTCDQGAAKSLLEGTGDISLVDGLDPEAGFFCLIDFSKLKGRSYCGMKITDEESLLRFLYSSENIKCIGGNCIGWPNPSDLVARITFALERKDIVRSIAVLRRAIGRLTS